MGPFKVDTIENAGENWLIADFGVDAEDGKHYILTTDHVHASELCALGTAREQAELACRLLNAQHEAKGNRLVPVIDGDSGLLHIHWIAGGNLMQSDCVPLSDTEGLGRLLAPLLSVVEAAEVVAPLAILATDVGCNCERCKAAHNLIDALARLKLSTLRLITQPSG